MKGGIGIPGLDSWLVGFSTDTEVIGLDTVPPDDRPPANTMLHWAFDTMVGHRHDADGARRLARDLLVAEARHPEDRTWFLRATAVSGVAAIVALECGWIVTEVGRQPWIVYEVMRTEDAVTDASGVWVTLGGRCSCSTRRSGSRPCCVLRAMARRWRTAERRGATCPTGRAPPPSADRGAGVSTADAVAAVLWVGVTFYAVFGGADFGAGFWTLVAGGERARQAAARADRLGDRPGLGGQPRLADLRARDALDGVLRGLRRRSCRRCSSRSASRRSGSCCAARASPSTASRRGARARRLAEAAFAVASVLTPFFMGTVVGRHRLGAACPIGNAEGDPVTSWLNPVSLLIGVLFVATGAYLAAVFLVSDARRFGDPELERYFARRALAAARS